MTDESNEGAAERRSRRLAAARLKLAGLDSHRPLDALLDGLGDRGATLPREAVHPRVLESVEGDGRVWTLLLWDDPGGAQRLHQQVQGLVEATLLAELSRTPKRVRSDGPERRFTALRLLSFASLDYDLAPALRAFGFVPEVVPPDADPGAAILAEADRAGRSVGTPTSAWRAPISHHGGALGEKLQEIEGMMAERLGDDVWGATPGGPSHLLATYIAKAMGEKVRPQLEGLRTLEMMLVQSERGPIRWIPTLLFQALCDFLPVTAAAEWDAKLEWAVCEDLGDGFAHPPLVRANRDEGAVHVPLGHHVLRWSVMPIFEGEDVDTLADWAVHEFGS